MLPLDDAYAYMLGNVDMHAGDSLCIEEKGRHRFVSSFIISPDVAHPPELFNHYCWLRPGQKVYTKGCTNNACVYVDVIQ